MREVLEKNTQIGSKPQMVRLGPVEGDPKGYWALRAIATPLLSEAKCGVEVEVSFQAELATCAIFIIPSTCSICL